MNLTESHTPIVSILLPVKNEAQYIRPCLDSIIAQSYSYWELIVIDDDSSDTTAAILQQYASKDIRIKPFANEGKGVIEALQYAFKLCSGSFITRMDGDDFMTKDRLKIMTTQLLSSGKGHVAVGCVQYFRQDQALGGGYQRYEQWLNALSVKGQNFAEIYKECTIPSPCWMTYKEDLIRIGAFDGLEYPEDYDLAFRMYAHDMKIVPASTDILLHWRDYADRSSRTLAYYADNRFISLKVKRFLSIDYKSDSPLILWGAGKKGKSIAQLLDRASTPFTWITDSPNKIGHNIYGHILQPTEQSLYGPTSQIIIAIANPEEQNVIKNRLKGLKHSTYWFC